MSSEGIKSYFSKEGIGVLCLMLPMIAKWILPSGLERELYVDIQGFFCFFVPNVFLLFTPFFFPKVEKISVVQLIVYMLWVSVSIIVVLLSKSEYPSYNLFSNFFLYSALYLGLFHHCSVRQTELIRPFLYFGIIIIALQIILLGEGIIDYNFGDIEQQYGKINRVSTTAGAATGTGAILAILAIMSIYVEGSKFVRLGVLLTAALGVLFTVSRSPILLLIMMILYILYHYRNVNKKNLLKAVVCIFILYIAGAFNPVIERQENKMEAEYFWSHRDELIKETMLLVDREEASLFGLGVGNVYPSTEVICANKKPPFEGAPHNSYVLLYAEQGLFGLLCVTIIIVIFLCGNYRRNPDLTVFLLLIFATVLFTETITITNSEYVYLIALLMMMINCNHRRNVFP